MKLANCIECALLIFVFFISFQSFFAQTTPEPEASDEGNASEACKTPGGDPGSCVRLSDCKLLVHSVGHHRNRGYYCGFNESKPKVCCPAGRAAMSAPLEASETPALEASETPALAASETPALEASAGAGKPQFLPASCGEKTEIHSRIVGGSKSRNGSWPWMAVIFYKLDSGSKSPDCGGALVTDHHVVTAAHCILDEDDETKTIDRKLLSVRLGGHNVGIEKEPGSVTVGVAAIRRHKSYNLKTNERDIAILKLNETVSFTKKISPVCLPYDSLNGEDLTNKSATVVGHGMTAYQGNTSDVLREVELDIFEPEVCRKAHTPKEKEFPNVFLCAGSMDGSKDACQGDSGGPLMTTGEDGRYYLVGIVSYGKKCGVPKTPGVYTRVTEFLTWLTTNLSD